MKKSIICAVFSALLTLAVFAEPMTKSAITSNTEKFLAGKGTYIKASFSVEDNSITTYIPRESIRNLEIRENKGVYFLFISADLFIYDERLSGIGFADIKREEFDGRSLATPANDIYIDSLGNLVIQKK